MRKFLDNSELLTAAELLEEKADSRWREGGLSDECGSLRDTAATMRHIAAVSLLGAAEQTSPNGPRMPTIWIRIQGTVGCAKE
jgi:hypothetical protein